jgi:hypothetical protein
MYGDGRRKGHQYFQRQWNDDFIDETYIYGVWIKYTFLMICCVCMIARKYHLTWKLKKSQWLPSKVEFVGVDIHRKRGNLPAQSK